MSNNSIELENAVLGRIIIDSKEISRVAPLISSDIFFDKSNRLIYDSILSLYQKGIDIEPSAVISELTKMNILSQVGGKEKILELTTHASLPKNLTKFIKELSEFSQLRNLDNAISKIKRDISGSKDTALDILNKAEEAVLGATRTIASSDFVHSKKIIEKAIKEIEDRANNKVPSGILTEFKDLDRLLGGFQRGDLVILAARPSMGKTSFALNIAANVARNKTVGFFSLEMPAHQLLTRILSSKASVNYSRLRDGRSLSSDEWNSIYLGRNQIEEMNLYIDETAGLTLTELIWKARKLHQTQQLDLIVIDYMQLINHATHGDNRQAEVSAISRALKQLARELKIPVIAISQLSRRVEQRENKRPMMSDLRESGAIEQDADLIMFLYREEYYKREDTGSIQSIEVIVSKHRNGPTGNVNLHFNLEDGTFSDFPEHSE